MKKIFLTLAIVLAMVAAANAQISRNDSFFTDWDDVSNGLDRVGEMPGLPGSHGLTGDEPAPLGSGLLILTALGAGYALKKKRD